MSDAQVGAWLWVAVTVTVAGGSASGCAAGSGASELSGSVAQTSVAATTGTGGGGGGFGAGGDGGAGGAAGATGSTVTGDFTGSGGSAGGVFSEVEVIITADNAYGFGYGDASAMLNYFGGVEATTAGQIFNCGEGPETYTVPAAAAAAGAFLYVVAYADKSTTQGVIAQFTRAGGGASVYTGTTDWQVCATGQDFSPPGGGPSLAVINAAIPGCTWYDSVGDASGKLQIGEDNTTPRQQVVIGNEFPVSCGIDDDARWMWFNWSPATLDWPNTGSPFIWPGGAGNPDRQFLIFRLRAEFVPPIPS